MAKTEVFRVGSLTFIGAIQKESSDGKIGTNERARVIVEGLGTIDLWGNEEEYRQAAKFFSRLADEQEESTRALKSGVGCGCSCDQQAVRGY